MGIQLCREDFKALGTVLLRQLLLFFGQLAFLGLLELFTEEGRAQNGHYFFHI